MFQRERSGISHQDLNERNVITMPSFGKHGFSRFSFVWFVLKVLENSIKYSRERERRFHFDIYHCKYFGKSLNFLFCDIISVMNTVNIPSCV